MYTIQLKGRWKDCIKSKSLIYAFKKKSTLNIKHQNKLIMKGWKEHFTWTVISWTVIHITVIIFPCILSSGITAKSPENLLS